MIQESLRGQVCEATYDQSSQSTMVQGRVWPGYLFLSYTRPVAVLMLVFFVAFRPLGHWP